MGLVPRQPMFPWMLGLLISLKLKNPVLYQAFVAGRRRGSDVMDFINESVAMRDQFSSIQHVLDQVEAYLYSTDKRYGTSENGEAPALEQLKLLQTGSVPTQPEHLSQKTRAATSSQAGRLINLIERIERPSFFGPGPVIAYNCCSLRRIAHRPSPGSSEKIGYKCGPFFLPPCDTNPLPDPHPTLL